ncbi:hypothetical protein NL676_034984 [Syzygium grande]|nr:hypothetical protein NL676_034984 [Syzygium grande]
MTTSAKDDGNAFPINDEDKDEYNIPEGEKNKSAKSIALEISDEPTLPPKHKQNLPKTETSGISPMTDEMRSETTDASIIPSTDNQLEGITDGIHQTLSIQTPSAVLLLPAPRQAVNSRSSLARQNENINKPVIVGIQEPSPMHVSAANLSPSSPWHSLSQPVGQTDVGESSSSSQAKVALEQVTRILKSRVTNSSNVTSESSLASIITDEVIEAKWTEFLELS